MYHTCLYCTRDLGTNEALEVLPIGRRLAFDESQGRLWVVCRGCEKWNLVPFDNRLEAIEECERLFRSAKLQFSTGNIGIARLTEGLELVRVGPALRPEFAAWRYGDQFGRRRKRTLMYLSAGALAAAGIYGGGLALGASMGAVPNLYNLFTVMYRSRVVAARLPYRNGVGGVLSLADLSHAKIRATPEGGWELEFKLRPSVRGRVLPFRGADAGVKVVDGSHAAEALGYLLPALNMSGGSRKVVQEAVTMVGGADMDQLIRRVTPKLWIPREKKYLPLHKLPVRHRLAVEMLAHEASEQKALAGELKLLEREWRNAEELAAIADSLAVPEATTDQLEQLRGRDS